MFAFVRLQIKAENRYLQSRFFEVVLVKWAYNYTKYHKIDKDG
jgi:hypothetical protein